MTLDELFALGQVRSGDDCPGIVNRDCGTHDNVKHCGTNNGSNTPDCREAANPSPAQCKNPPVQL